LEGLGYPIYPNLFTSKIYIFCLSQQLESHKNLVDQCVQGEGLVQINVQIKPMQKRINIVDVLKPADDYIEVVENNCMYECIYRLYSVIQCKYCK